MRRQEKHRDGFAERVATLASSDEKYLGTGRLVSDDPLDRSNHPRRPVLGPDDQPAELDRTGLEATHPSNQGNPCVSEGNQSW
ncbi:MAG: hypothetical protein GY741_16925, partial [Phycisphaeraceae bacterium]|nr:hypothetical protein [Phycisphaeraceae bacterium]